MEIVIYMNPNTFKLYVLLANFNSSLRIIRQFSDPSV